MPDEHAFATSNTTKGKPASLPFKLIKNEILGKKYILSLVFIGDVRSKALNKKYRKKNTPANILSFPLSKNEGEIFINQRQAKRDCKKFGVSHRRFIGHLFIHGLLHLKGFTHGSKMNSAEQSIQKKFDL